MRLFSSLRSRLMRIGILALLPALGLVLYNGAQLREQAAANAKDDALRLVHLAASNQPAHRRNASRECATQARLAFDQTINEVRN